MSKKQNEHEKIKELQDTISQRDKQLDLKDQRIQELEEKVRKYQENGYHDYLNSPQYIHDKNADKSVESENKQLKDKIKELSKKLKRKEEEIQKLKNEISISNMINEAFEKAVDGEVKPRVKNERGAGRKARFTEAERESMKMYRIQGRKLQEIAAMYQCSVGLVHKIINEK